MVDKYPSWQCQRCGAKIGWLGRFVEFIYSPLLRAVKSIYHDCPGLFYREGKECSSPDNEDRKKQTKTKSKPG